MNARRPKTLRVVSLNVCRLQPGRPRGRIRALQVGSLLSDLDADLVALQELEHDCEEQSLTDAFGDTHEGHWILGRHSRSGMRGVALRSRVPASTGEGRLSEARLPARAMDDKGYARGVFDVPSLGSAVEVIAVHLDPFSRRTRHRQIAMLAAAVGPARVPRVVLGDLNAMTVGDFLHGRDHDDTVSRLADALGVRPASTTPKTFPDVFPLFAIDWVLASPELEFSGEVHAIRAGVSDHAAIVADLILAA